MPVRPLLLLALALTVTAAEPTVPATAQEVRPLAVGAQAPVTARLQRPDGSAVTLGEALAGRPTVVVFYRGGWCPYCVRQLAGLGPIVPELEAAGWSLLAIAPDGPEGIRIATAKAGDTLTRLSDGAGEAMRAFGIAFRLDDATTAKYREYGIDLARASGHAHGQLPVPSVFAIAADGTLRFVHADPDYTRRLDPQALLKAVRAGR